MRREQGGRRAGLTSGSVGALSAHHARNQELVCVGGRGWVRGRRGREGSPDSAGEAVTAEPSGAECLVSRHGAGGEQRPGGDGDAVRTSGTDAAASKSSGGRGDGPFPACQLPLKSVCQESCVASTRFSGCSGPSAPHGPSQDLSLSRHRRFGSPRTAPGAVGPALLPATLQPRSRLRSGCSLSLCPALTPALAGGSQLLPRFRLQNFRNISPTTSGSSAEQTLRRGRGHGETWRRRQSHQSCPCSCPAARGEPGAPFRTSHSRVREPFARPHFVGSLTTSGAKAPIIIISAARLPTAARRELLVRLPPRRRLTGFS